MRGERCSYSSLTRPENPIAEGEKEAVEEDIVGPVGLESWTFSMEPHPVIGMVSETTAEENLEGMDLGGGTGIGPKSGLSLEGGIPFLPHPDRSESEAMTVSEKELEEEARHADLFAGMNIFAEGGSASITNWALSNKIMA
jgi:hypothetical protein